MKKSILAVLAIMCLSFVPASAITVQLLGGNDIENARELEGDVTYDINIQRQLGESGHFALEGAFSRTQIGTEPGTHVYTYDTRLNLLYTFNPEDKFKLAVFGGVGPGAVEGVETDQSSYMSWNAGGEFQFKMNEYVGFLFRSSISDRFREVGELYQQESGSDPVWDNVVGVVFFDRNPQ